MDLTMGPVAAAPTGRLYIVIRNDLPPGLQAAQAAHAAFEFALAYPELTDEWATTSNNLILVAVDDEAALYRLERARLGMPHLLVHEPDLDDQATAMVLGPDQAAKQLCRNLPLALQDHQM
jgi:peptidyl-tRNA hydrolase